MYTMRLTQNNSVTMMQTMRRNHSMQNRTILIQCDRALRARALVSVCVCVCARSCDDCNPARRNLCQNSAPPSAAFNLPVVQSNDGAEYRTTHVIKSSQPVRGSSATFARSSQTKIEDAGARSMSQPLLRPRSDSSQCMDGNIIPSPTYWESM